MKTQKILQNEALQKYHKALFSSEWYNGIKSTWILLTKRLHSFRSVLQSLLLPKNIVRTIGMKGKRICRMIYLKDVYLLDTVENVDMKLFVSIVMMV